MNTSSDRERLMSVSIDGEQCVELMCGQSLCIVRGRNKIKFIDLIGNSFHESLCRKMMKPIK